MVNKHMEWFSMSSVIKKRQLKPGCDTISQPTGIAIIKKIDSDKC